MDEKYIVPAETRIGHIHLKVADITRSMDFYCGLLGFELITTYGTEAAFISAGGYHHHIGLNTWYSKNADGAVAFCRLVSHGNSVSDKKRPGCYLSTAATKKLSSHGNR